MRETLRQCARYAVLFCFPSARFQIAEGICRRMPLYLPCDLLQAVKERYGTGALLAAEAILFGWCFAFALVLDLYSGRHFPAGGILGFLCCAAAFTLCGEDRSRFLIKICYLLCTLSLGGSWLIAAGFLLVFERVTAHFE